MRKRKDLFLWMQAPLCTGPQASSKHRARRMWWCARGCCIQCPHCGFSRGPCFQTEVYVAKELAPAKTWIQRVFELQKLMRSPYITINKGK
ncbi:MAG: hypothetical protein Q8P59_09975 [Dehalococcoidia bacterium]|nr:hypothetical protein [Dehalococcoidia bacterium]